MFNVLDKDFGHFVRFLKSAFKTRAEAQAWADDYARRQPEVRNFEVVEDQVRPETYQQRHAAIVAGIRRLNQQLAELERTAR